METPVQLAPVFHAASRHGLVGDSLGKGEILFRQARDGHLEQPGFMRARISNSSSISSSDSEDTTVPLCSSDTTRPSASSWRIASRSGTRETPSSVASFSWRRASPPAAGR